MMRVLLPGAIALAALMAPAMAGPAAPQAGPSAVIGTSAIRIDWQDPARLPRRYRNHCVAEPSSGRTYCENHCGRGYAFYYCSSASFGCCHVGYGYCDWHGELRCHP